MLVSENTTFSTATLSHEASSSIDSSRMELHELGVFDSESSAGNHTTTITSAGVSGGATLVGSSVSTGGQNSLVSAHSVDSSISHVVSHNSGNISVGVLDQVHSEVLDEEDGIVTKSTSHEGVKHRVTSSISDAAASVGLSTFTKVLRLSSESSLVDLTFSGATERHTVRFELTHSDGSFSGHVLDGVLISKPISTLNGVIEMPFP